MIYRSVR